MAAAHWRQWLGVRAAGCNMLVDLIEEVSLSLIVHCILAYWDFSTANLIAVGGGAGAVAIAATGYRTGGGAIGRGEERGGGTGTGRT